MKNIILVLLAALSICSNANAESSAKENVMPRISVKGNHFVNDRGDSIVFRGLCLADPVKLIGQRQWNERLFAEAADWGANIVRFAIHPININRMGWNETFEAIDNGIEWAKANNLYVILDWHSIGNLKDEKYTRPMYNTTKEETFRFWRVAAQRYANESAVALYEVFNEPTVNADQNVGTATWAEWKALQEQIIDTIRAYSPKAVCLCAGFNWAYDLTPIAKQPIERGQVAYVSHPYPMKRSEPWEEQWEKDWGYVADKYPVVCTEIGYCLEGERGAHIPVISTDAYGDHITKYLEQRGISFTVWCFDRDYAPTLISDWNYTPTTSGRYFKTYLQSKKK